MAARTRAAFTVLLAATRRMLAGSRPTRWAACWMRSCTRVTFCAIERTFSVLCAAVSSITDPHSRLAVLYQAFGEHGPDGPIKGYETLVNIGRRMHPGEDATAARHQVHTTHLQRLTEAILDRSRDVFQGCGIHPFDRTGPEVDVKCGGLPVYTRGDFLLIDDLAQALTQTLRHAVGLGLHLPHSHNAQ